MYTREVAGGAKEQMLKNRSSSFRFQTISSPEDGEATGADEDAAGAGDDDDVSRLVLRLMGASSA